MALYVSKGVIVVYMISFLVCVHFIAGSNARKIKYGAIISGDLISPCNLKHPEKCKHRGPSNPYRRGCEHIEQCRDDNPGNGGDDNGLKEKIVHHHHGKHQPYTKIMGHSIVKDVIPSPLKI